VNNYQVGEVDARSLIIFPQPRRVFDGIEELRDSILENEMFSLPIVAALSKLAFGEYTAVINELWCTDFDPGSFKPFKDGKYYVLIAGERRTRAHCLLAKEWKVPWEYLVHLREDIPALAALFIQFAENTHRRVPPDQEAYSYNQFFRVLKKRHPETTLAKFARMVGRSSEAIRNALRFCELPEKVRIMVEEKHLHYSVAVELWRLEQAEIPDEEIERWAFRAVIEKRKADEFHKMISDYLFVRGQGQVSLFGIMSENQREALHRQHRRRTVEGKLVPIHTEQKRYFETVARLISEGLLGEKDSPYASGSPAKRLKALVQTVRTLLPHLEAITSSRQHVEAEQVLVQAESALARITK